jgi:hypothetical protein
MKNIEVFQKLWGVNKTLLQELYCKTEKNEDTIELINKSIYERY